MLWITSSTNIYYPTYVGCTGRNIMGVIDELSVGIEELNAATEQIGAGDLGSTSTDEIGEDTSDEIQDVNSDVDLPELDFWEETEADRRDEKGNVPSEEPEDDVGEDAPEGDMFRYQADGEEKELPASEVAKILASYDGNRKWTGEKGKLTKRLRRMEGENSELRKYKDSFDKLEDIKHDKRQLFKLITGEEYEDVISQEVSRKMLYERGSEADRRILDMEAQLEEERVARERDKAAIERERRIAEEKRESARKETVHNRMVAEWQKNIGEDTPPNIRKAIWRQAALELKDYNNKYGRLTSKMYERAFADAAAMLNTHIDRQVDTKVSKVISERKQSAKEKAQLDSTRNYKRGNDIESEWLGKNPLDLFKSMTRKKR